MDDHGEVNSDMMFGKDRRFSPEFRKNLIGPTEWLGSTAEKPQPHHVADTQRTAT